MNISLQVVVSTSLLAMSAACAGMDAEGVGTADAEPAQQGMTTAPHAGGQHDALDAPLVGADAEASFVGLDGEEVGKAFASGGPHGTLFRIDVSDIDHGFHGFHVHEVGTCEPETGFASAGAHYDPRGNDHGLFEDDGPHVGDLANVYAHQDGHVRTDVFATGTMLDAVMDADGFALMIHAKPDDYTSQPGGTSGDRVACAAFPGGM